jgi:hypothetical protein
VRSRFLAGAAVIAALAIPAALLADDTPMAAPLQPGRPPYIRPPYTPKPARPVPRPTYRPGYRPGYNNGRYPVIIDGSIVNRYLGTPAPAATPTKRPKPKYTKRPDGEDQFETHSSTDANE